MKSHKVCGYKGKIIRVDLTTQSIITEPTMKYAREWLGGDGIGIRILYDEVKPWVTPYEPANRLIIGAGPLVGTLAPGATRVAVDSKNAATQGVGSSNACGFFGQELKFAGYDHIIVHGKARYPVYLWVHDDRVAIKDARHLWGKTTWETVDAIRNELDDCDIHTMSIGPAGENVVRGSCIIIDKGRALGRCGFGGIMGSKNLKAIAVRGTGAVEVAEKERFLNAVGESRSKFDASISGIAPVFIRHGTISVTPGKSTHCMLPYKNFQYLDWPQEMKERFDAEYIRNKYRKRNLSSMACPIPCGRYYWVEDGPYAGLGAEGFQFEDMADFGGKLAVDDPAFLMKAHTYCNQLGLDIDAAAGSIAWAMECYQRGILTESDADGLKLEWGDAGVALELMRRIAYREGFGSILGEGSAHAADVFGKGSEYYAMHLKGQDLYEVIRTSIAWGLGACVSTRGGGHTTGCPICETNFVVDPEACKRKFGVTTFNDPLAFEGKPELVMYYEMLHRVNNCLGVCHFTTDWLDIVFPGFPELAELYSAATGLETTEDDLRTIGMRILNLEKAFNILHAGFGRKHDYPPERMLEEPVPSGRVKGWKIGRKNWDKLLDDYYKLHHWDTKTSFPTRECLEKLGLKEVADDLENAGRLGKRRTN